MKTIYIQPNQSLNEILKTCNSGDQIVLLNKVYREKVRIFTPNITIIGGDETIIVNDDCANKVHQDGLDYNTFRTYTLGIFAENVCLKNLTVVNDAGNPIEKGQAVALTVYAKGFKAENLTLKSLQDTLFLGPLPDDLITRYDGFLTDYERYVEGELESYFVNCKIYGSLDYVFGSGTALFENCDFININDNRAIGYVCAPSHSLKQALGFTFYNCNFTKEEGFNSEIYLARPWRDYGKCTFISCKTPSITPQAFDRWNDTYRNQTARFEHFDCSLNPVDWAKELTKEQADKILSNAFKKCKN